MSVLLTRPEAESREIATALARAGLECLIWPLTRIEPTGAPAEPPPGTEALLVTSANGLRAFAAAWPGRDLPVLAVGERTAALARSLGFGDVASASGDSADLAALARAAGHRHLFHPRGAATAGDLAGRLAEAGIAVTPTVLYRAIPTGPPPPAVAALLARAPVPLITVWSPRNARLFADWQAGARLFDPAGARAVAISPAAAAPLSPLGLAAVTTAARPDRAAMIVAIRTAHAALRR